MKNVILFEQYVEDGEPIVHELPAMWIICGQCRGEGMSSAYLGAISQEDRERDWDPDDWDAYMDGAYDRPCDCCGGTGKVRELNEEACDKEVLALYHKAAQEEREYEAMCRAERAMGA